MASSASVNCLKFYMFTTCLRYFIYLSSRKLSHLLASSRLPGLPDRNGAEQPACALVLLLLLLYAILLLSSAAAALGISSSLSLSISLSSPGWLGRGLPRAHNIRGRFLDGPDPLSALPAAALPAGAALPAWGHRLGTAGLVHTYLAYLPYNRTEKVLI